MGAGEWRSEEGVGKLELQVIVSHLIRMLGLNSGPLEEQKMLLTTLQPQFIKRLSWPGRVAQDCNPRTWGWRQKIRKVQGPLHYRANWRLA